MVSRPFCLPLAHPHSNPSSPLVPRPVLQFPLIPLPASSALLDPAPIPQSFPCSPACLPLCPQTLLFPSSCSYLCPLMAHLLLSPSPSPAREFLLPTPGFLVPKHLSTPQFPVSPAFQSTAPLAAPLCSHLLSRLISADTRRNDLPGSPSPVCLPTFCPAPLIRPQAPVLRRAPSIFSSETPRDANREDWSHWEGLPLTQTPCPPPTVNHTQGQNHTYWSTEGDRLHLSSLLQPDPHSTMSKSL